MLLRFCVLLTALCWLCGCSHYDNFIVEPANYAGPVPHEPMRITRDDIEYRIAQREQILAMRIVNDTDEPVTLLGERSYVVDAEGESHPIRGATIAPHSYIHMTFPPLPRVSRGGSVGFGIGVGVHSDPGYYGGGHIFHDHFHDPPIVNYYDVDPAYAWNWKTGEIRVHFVAERATEALTHEWVFDRRKR